MFYALLGVLLLLSNIWASVGVELFGDSVNDASRDPMALCSPVCGSFDSWSDAMLALSQVSLGNGWVQLMYHTMAAVHHRGGWSYGEAWWVTSGYYTTFFFTVNVVLANLLGALVIEIYIVETEKSKREQSNQDALNDLFDRSAEQGTARNLAKEAFERTHGHLTPLAPDGNGNGENNGSSAASSSSSPSPGGRARASTAAGRPNGSNGNGPGSGGPRRCSSCGTDGGRRSITGLGRSSVSGGSGMGGRRGSSTHARLSCGVSSLRNSVVVCASNVAEAMHATNGLQPGTPGYRASVSNVSSCGGGGAPSPIGGGNRRRSSAEQPSPGGGSAGMGGGGGGRASVMERMHRCSSFGQGANGNGGGGSRDSVRASTRKRMSTYDQRNFEKPMEMAEILTDSVHAKFSKYDTRNAGVISAADCGELLRELGETTLDEAGLALLIAELDADGSGLIDFREFLDWWQHHGMQRVFMRFDKDQSGSIDTEELQALLESLGISLSPSQLQKAQAMLDPDGDGCISWDEYLKWWERFDVQRIFEQYDADGSGAISAHEMQLLCSDLGVHLTWGEVKKALKKLDKDGSASLSFDEFYPWWVSICDLKYESQLVVDYKGGRWEDNLFLQTNKLDALKARQRTALTELARDFKLAQNVVDALSRRLELEMTDGKIAKDGPLSAHDLAAAQAISDALTAGGAGKGGRGKGGGVEQALARSKEMHHEASDGCGSRRDSCQFGAAGGNRGNRGGGRGATAQQPSCVDRASQLLRVGADVLRHPAKLRESVRPSTLLQSMRASRLGSCGEGGEVGCRCSADDGAGGGGGGGLSAGDSGRGSSQEAASNLRQSKAAAGLRQSKGNLRQSKGAQPQGKMVLGGNVKRRPKRNAIAPGGGGGGAGAADGGGGGGGGVGVGGGGGASSDAEDRRRRFPGGGRVSASRSSLVGGGGGGRRSCASVADAESGRGSVESAAGGGRHIGGGGGRGGNSLGSLVETERGSEASERGSLAMAEEAAPATEGDDAPSASGGGGGGGGGAPAFKPSESSMMMGLLRRGSCGASAAIISRAQARGTFGGSRHAAVADEDATPATAATAAAAAAAAAASSASDAPEADAEYFCVGGSAAAAEAGGPAGGPDTVSSFDGGDVPRPPPLDVVSVDSTEQQPA